MCHLILLMPVLGILVFWIWPISISLPVYLIILSISLLVYFSLLRAMHKPVTTGQEGLMNEVGQLTDIINHKGHVTIHGEIWNAETNLNLKKGDIVRVTDVKGLTLTVQKTEQKLTHV